MKFGHAMPLAAAIWLAAGTTAISASAAVPDASRYPSKPIRIIVPSAPGSGPDIIARLVGGTFTERWEQQVVADNRAGAAGNIGVEIASKAAPDGYTLLLANSQQIISTVILEKLPYDLLRDFSPICLLASTPYVLVVNPSVPATSVKELIALAKAKPGTLHYGSSGVGGAPYLGAEMLKTMSDIDLVHVPYKSVVYALIDVMGGQVQLAFSALPAASQMVRQGKLRALGVTSLKRTPLAPDLEAIAETVPGYEMIGWTGLVAPVRTPDGIVAKLNAATIGALKSAEIQEKLHALGFEPIGTTPREFTSFLSAQLEKMRKTVKASGMRMGL